MQRAGSISWRRRTAARQPKPRGSNWRHYPGSNSRRQVKPGLPLRAHPRQEYQPVPRHRRPQDTPGPTGHWTASTPGQAGIGIQFAELHRGPDAPGSAKWQIITRRGQTDNRGERRKLRWHDANWPSTGRAALDWKDRGRRHGGRCQGPGVQVSYFAEEGFAMNGASPPACRKKLIVVARPRIAQPSASRGTNHIIPQNAPRARATARPFPPPPDRPRPSASPPYAPLPDAAWDRSGSPRHGCRAARMHAARRAAAKSDSHSHRPVSRHQVGVRIASPRLDQVYGSVPGEASRQVSRSAVSYIRSPNADWSRAP